MARTTAAEVKQIIETSLSDAIVNGYITSANIFVTNHLGTSTLDASTLEDIERWVTAHMISMTRERQAKKEKAGSAEVEYGQEFRAGLRNTLYGQTAIALDTTGTLDAIDEGRRDIVLQAL